MAKQETKRRCLAEEIVTTITEGKNDSSVHQVFFYDYDRESFDGKPVTVSLDTREEWVSFKRGGRSYSKEELRAYIADLESALEKM